MPELPAIGLRLHGGLDPRVCIELADIAEANGLSSVWFAENPFQRGMMPAASACAWMTRRLRIGLGIVNVYAHHPTLIAMEFTALDELAQGRAVLGIGSGIGRLVERMGFAWQPLASMRDAIEILRGLLAGEEVTYRGRVFSVEKARLGFQPSRPDAPIYMAAMGDRSLDLCGRLADGLIVSNLCPPRYTERAVAIVGQAAADAGRAAPAVVQYVPCVALADRDMARRAAMAQIGEMMATFWPIDSGWPVLRETIVELSGIPRSAFVAALDRLRGGEPAEQVLDERFINAFAICGTAEDCLARAANYRTAGVDELVLTFAGDEPPNEIEYLGGALAKARR
jgi:5,10-methylenetetrahydromethanopterin reductase